MQFENFFLAHSTMLWGIFCLSIILGAIVNKTNFCTMGAISDLINIGDASRMRSWFFAISIALFGASIFEYFDLLNLSETFPPYRGNIFIFGENILGGLMFGIGMTLASGCGNKCLIRIGGGNLKSIFVFAIIGLVSYFMLNPFPNSDKTLFSILFYDWLRPISIELSTNQDIASLIPSENQSTLRFFLGSIIGLVLLYFVFKSKEFRGNKDYWLGGLMVGLAVLFAWYLTANLSINADGDSLGLNEYHEQWDMFMDSDEKKPASGATLSTQSFTFINPMGQTGAYLVKGFDTALLTFGVMAVFGVTLGSFIWSLLSGSFKFEWFSSFSDFKNHIIGAILMGFGGTLALGCTIGQAISGISTLALGSILTFLAIFVSTAMTMKIQYYRMVYESEATFLKAFITGFVDLKLLPESFRKLKNI